MKSKNIKLVKSTTTRATETANIILSLLPDIEHGYCNLLREGAPCVPDPPIGNVLDTENIQFKLIIICTESWSPEPADFYQEEARIEAEFMAQDES